MTMDWVYLHMHAHYVGNIIVQNYMVINTDSESSLVLDIWLVMVFREPLSFIFMDLDRNKVLGFERWYKPTDGKLLPWSAKWKWWGWMLECSAGLDGPLVFLSAEACSPYLWLHCNGVSIVLEFKKKEKKEIPKLIFSCSLFIYASFSLCCFIILTWTNPFILYMFQWSLKRAIAR